MAKQVEFSYFDISGQFVKSDTTLLKYPYLYSIASNGAVYRLNVVSKFSELLYTIDLETLLPPQSNVTSRTVYGGSLNVDTDKMYFWAALYYTSTYYYRYVYLCEIDLSNMSCRVLGGVRFAEYSSYKFILNTRFEQIDNNTIKLYLYNVKHYTSTYYKVWYEISTIDLNTFNQNYIGSYDSPYVGTLNYQPAGINPQIIQPETNKNLLYGVHTEQGNYITKTGFTYYENPSVVDTYNSLKYNNIGLFELNNQYYAIGGAIETNANVDILQINPTSLSSNKIGESRNTSTDVPAIGTTEDNAFIVFDDSTLCVASLVEYNLTYTFKNNEGETLAELTGKLPIREMNIGNVGNSVSVVVTYSDYTTDTVSFDIADIPDHKFIGFNDTPNSKRAMVVEGSNSVYIYNDMTFYPVYVKYIVPSTTFDINLYQSTAEKNRVDKTNYLTSVGLLKGALREQCSIVSPSITYQAETFPNFNYVFISAFGRYYFVNSISSVGKNLWKMDLSCDVLMTYEAEIVQLTALIARQENDYNDDLVDNEIPTEKEPTVTYQEITNTVLNTQAAASTHNFVLTVVGS